MSDYKIRSYFEKINPRETDLVCEFKVEPNKVSLEKAAQHIAAESSIGTWTDVTTLKPRIIHKLKPKIFFIDKKSKTVRIAYPIDLFEKGNMPQILSSIAGNIFGMGAVKKLRLEDIAFPKAIINSFLGPRFGIMGIRKITRIKKRPLVGTIIKPKLGLSSKEHALVAYDAWSGGCDIVKDDENLTSQGFNSFEERLKETLKMREKAEAETGEKKMYVPNITAETCEMISRAKKVKEYNNEYVMIDIITSGFAALQTLRKEDLGLIIHAHRAGHAAFTRGDHGISMLTIAKISRLIGVDQLHIGTAQLGKMESPKEEVLGIEEEIEESVIKKKSHMLEQKWFNIKPVFAVTSGGLYPGTIPKLVQRMGSNIIIQAGGGIHGHKNGTIAGAAAMRQAVDAAMNNIDLREYAKEHRELKQAIKQWGVA